eukprot:SAG31_NODE_338_length_17490_cov_7.707032_11_plen_130_part_00
MASTYVSDVHRCASSAMIIMKEKNMLGYFIPAYCGCCLVPAPLSYLMWKKNADTDNNTDEEVKDDKGTDEKGGDGEEKAPDSAAGGGLDSMSAMERFFFDVYAPLIDKLKIPIVVRHILEFLSLFFSFF